MLLLLLFYAHALFLMVGLCRDVSDVLILPSNVFFAL